MLCKSPFKVKYNLLKKQYSLKNNWGYWTGKEENKNDYLCDKCLVRLHKGNMRDWIMDGNRAEVFYDYFRQGRFGKEK